MSLSWRAHCHATNHNLSHLEFLRHVTLALLHYESSSSERLPQGGAYPVDESRFNGINHDTLASGTQDRCKVCKKNTKM